MIISLSATRARSLTLSAIDVENEEFSLQFSPAYADGEDVTSFMVIFDISYKSSDNYQLELTYEAIFETDTAVNDEFKATHFPEVNAPAIAYPYLRSFVTTMTVSAGYNALMLPTVNFSALAQERQKAVAAESADSSD